MKFSDFKGLFKKSTAEVISVENPYNDYYVVKLKPETGLQWEAGEHGIYSLPNNNVEGKKWRAFSVASTVDEGYLQIGTRTGDNVSSFKKELISLKEGDKVSVRGPFGWFKLQDTTSPLVLIATGVGITPIRALAKELEDDTKRDVDVIYASKEFYLFDDEISGFAKNNSKIAINKTKSSEETKAKIKESAAKYSNEAYYYVSGSMDAIGSIKNQLVSEGIKKNRIINDPFMGY